MKTVEYIVAALVLTAISLGGSLSQERTVIAGLASDSLYMAMIEQESLLKAKEDSLTAHVARTRAMFRSDPDNRSRYSEDILRLESEIFDIRNRIGITSGRINSVEQQYVIRNLTEGFPGPGTDSGVTAGEEKSPVIVLNPFFENNLGADDYSLLLEAQKKEVPIVENIAGFVENYRAIAEIGRKVELADNAVEADSLYRRYEILRSLNDGFSEAVARDLAFVYENKLYCYNYILDKLGLNGELSAFEKKTAAATEHALAAGETAESQEIAGYVHRKLLLLDYETTLAGIAGYKASLDSLAQAKKELAGLDLEIPSVTVNEKLFLDLSDIEFHSPAKYDSRNPVPALTIHPKGEIYRVLLGSFQRPQPVSVLKGTYPVGVLVQEGRSAYYAGGFETLEAAVEAVEMLKGKGFRDPKIAHWSDGHYRLIEQAEADRLLGNAATGLFRLSVDTGGNPLPAVVREIVEDLAPEAEISRSGDLFIIGPFPSRQNAVELMEDIVAETDGVVIKIEGVG